MKLPFPTDPYAGLDRDTRIPVRSNIPPRIYDHIFTQLCPLHGTQAQIIAHVLSKLHTQILTDPLLDANRIHKPDGTIAFFYDENVPAAIATIVARCSFDSGPSDSGTGPTPVGQEAGSGNDPGGNPGTRDVSADLADLSPDTAGQISPDAGEGFRRLAQAIFKS